MKTKQEAIDIARKCLGLMTTKGWKIHVYGEHHEWHWRLMNRFFLLDQSYSDQSYSCVMTSDPFYKQFGGGEIRLKDEGTYHDPNEAVQAMTKICQQHIEKYQKALNTMLDSFSGELPLESDEKYQRNYETVEQHP